MSRILSTDRALELAVALAPELRGRLEIVANRPEWPRAPRRCGAYYHPLLMPALDWLSARGVSWKSPPAVIVACYPLTPELLIHEVGHAVPPRRLVFDLTDAEYDELRSRQPAALAAVADEIDARGADAPDNQHGARWLRAVCHLWARAEAAGLDLRPVKINATPWFDHDIGEYRARLGWEPVKFARKTFEEIESEPPPDCFLDLFQRDQQARLNRLHHEELAT